MRHAFNGKEIFKTKDDTFYGINLGYDFCAEHEWGIEKLERFFGVDTSIPGIKGRKQTTEVKSFKVMQFTKNKEKFVALVVCDAWKLAYYQENKKFKDFILGMIGTPYKSEFASSWSDSEFGLVVSLENKYIIDAIVEAIETKNLVIGIGANANPFSRGGLILMFENKIPNEISEAVLEEDLDAIRLQEKAFKKTNIKTILKLAGKKYFALSPKWKDETKKEVIYWLNPEDQQNVNFGWFTLKELKLWAINKGPIPKTK